MRWWTRSKKRKRGECDRVFRKKDWMIKKKERKQTFGKKKPKQLYNERNIEEGWEK